MEKNAQTFEYTYSAAANKEINKIRKEYLPREESKLDQLRRLDESTEKKGTACALALGVLSALILGLGMCCTMVWGYVLFVPGIIIGLIGITGITLAYPLNQHMTRKERERLAPEILRLSSELLSGQS